MSLFVKYLVECVEEAPHIVVHNKFYLFFKTKTDIFYLLFLKENIGKKVCQLYFWVTRVQDIRFPV